MVACTDALLEYKKINKSDKRSTYMEAGACSSSTGYHIANRKIIEFLMSK